LVIGDWLKAYIGARHNRAKNSARRSLGYLYHLIAPVLIRRSPGPALEQPPMERQIWLALGSNHVAGISLWERLKTGANKRYK